MVRLTLKTVSGLLWLLANALDTLLGWVLDLKEMADAPLTYQHFLSWTNELTGDRESCVWVCQKPAIKPTEALSIVTEWYQHTQRPSPRIRGLTVSTLTPSGKPSETL